MKLLRIFTAFVISSLAVFPTMAEKNTSLRVGFIVPLTGPLAHFGAAIRNGVDLAIEEAGQESAQFSLHYEDSQYLSKVAIANFQKLKGTDKVHLFYVFGGPMSASLAPLAERARLPMFSTEYDISYTRGRKYVFRFANNAGDYAEVLYDELFSRGYKKFGVIKNENQFHNTWYNAFAEVASKRGAEVDLLFNFQPGEDNFRPAITRIKQSQYDALGAFLLPGQNHTFFTQAKAQNLMGNFFGTDTLESEEERRGVEQLVEGATYVNNSVTDSFIAKYNAAYGNLVQIGHAALAYEFIRLTMAKFAGVDGALSPDEIVSRYQLDDGVPGESTGEYFYRNAPEFGQYFSFPIAARRIKSGRSRIVRVVPAP